MVTPLVLEASRAESVASLSIAGVDSRYYARRLDAIAAGLDPESTSFNSVMFDNNNNNTLPPASELHDDEEENSQPGEEGEGSHYSQENDSFQKKQAAHSKNLTEGLDKENEMNDADAAADADATKTNMEAQKEPEMDFGPPKEELEFAVGDHIYQWCFFGPFPYQHHAIVMEVFREEEEAPQRLRVADFSNWKPENQKNEAGEEVVRPSSGLGQSFAGNERRMWLRDAPAGSENATFQGCIRTYESEAKDWHKVLYEVGFWKRHLSWSGTCTSTASDPPAMVRARVQFLVDNPDAIPSYNTIQSNCECVALWCKTGTWSTLQAASWLSTTAAGQVKSAVTLAGAATATQVPVTIPAAGVWGWMGFTTTTQISLAAAQPLLLPAIAAFGVITVGVPAISLALADRHWKKMTATLNEKFWNAAIAQPDLFVECITYWSTQSE